MTDDTQIQTETEGQSEATSTQEAKSQITKPIDEANKAAKRLEDANETKQALLDREEALMVRQALSGRSEAGDVPVKKAPETDEEFTQRFESGNIDLLV